MTCVHHSSTERKLVLIFILVKTKIFDMCFLFESEFKFSHIFKDLIAFFLLLNKIELCSICIQCTSLVKHMSCMWNNCASKKTILATLRLPSNSLRGRIIWEIIFMVMCQQFCLCVSVKHTHKKKMYIYKYGGSYRMSGGGVGYRIVRIYVFSPGKTKRALQFQ